MPTIDHRPSAVAARTPPPMLAIVMAAYAASEFPSLPHRRKVGQPSPTTPPIPAPLHLLAGPPGPGPTRLPWKPRRTCEWAGLYGRHRAFWRQAWLLGVSHRPDRRS